MISNLEQARLTCRQRAAEWKRQADELTAEIERLKAQNPVF